MGSNRENKTGWKITLEDVDCEFCYITVKKNDWIFVWEGFDCCSFCGNKKLNKISTEKKIVAKQKNRAFGKLVDSSVERGEIIIDEMKAAMDEVDEDCRKMWIK